MTEPCNHNYSLYEKDGKKYCYTCDREVKVKNKDDAKQQKDS